MKRITTFLLLISSFVPWLLGGPVAANDRPPTSPDGAFETVVETFDSPRVVTRGVARGDAMMALSSGSGFLSVDQDPEGDLPRAVAFLPDGSAAVIANRDTDTVTFFDVNTKTITHTVTVGDFPVDVAVTPNGQYAIVPCVFADAVFVVDVATHAVAAVVPVTGTQPFRVRVTANGQFAVAGVINDAVNSAFSVISLATLTEVRSIPSASQGVFGFFFTPESGISGNIFTQFDVSADDKTIVLPGRSSSTVFLYDLTNGAQIAALATAAAPTSVDVSPDGTVAVIGHEGTAQTVTVVDLVTPGIAAAHAVGTSLVNQVIRVTPSKSHALAAIQNALIFVDLATGAVTSTISTGTVGDIQFTFDGAFAYVSNANSRVIDVATQTLVKTIPFEPCVEAAASPTQRRVVALNNRFRENVLLFDVNGASGFAEASTQSGEPAEGDAPRTLAIAGDGNTIVSANNLSANASVIELDARTVRAYPAAGDRPLGVAVSADGTTAVVCNGDEDTVSIIDLATDQTVKQIALPTRPAEVLISPDGAWAYVTTIAGTDRLHFISLNGAASAVVSSLPTGQMGSIGYTYNVVSGMALSADGTILVVCISFDDQLMIVDTQTRAEINRLGTGDFPIRAAFAGSRCFVTNSFSDDVSVYDVTLLAQILLTKVGPIEFPLDVVPDDAGAYAYVGSFDFSQPKVAVIDSLGGLFLAGSVPVPTPPRVIRHSPITDRLYVACSGGDLVRVAAAGPASAVIDTTPLTGSPSDMVFSELFRAAACAQPGVRDGLDLVSYADECPGSITSFGSGCAGSGGFVPSLALAGCARDAGLLRLTVDDALGGTLGFLFFGLGMASLPLDGTCTLNVAPLIGPIVGLPLFGAGPGNGGLEFTGQLPPGVTGFTIDLQLFVIDAGVAHGYSNTNGVQLFVP